MTTLFYALVDFVAMRYRPAAVIFVVLPLSTLLRVAEKNRKRLQKVRNLTSTAESRHESRVARVSRAVGSRPDRTKQICTSRSPFASFSMRFSEYKKTAERVFVGDFDEILGFDDEKVKVEPLCTVGDIADHLIRHGLMMQTTLEVRDATIGGLAMAVAMTTSSHKYGLLQETVLEYELVLADGRVVKATRDNEYADLFHATAWSHGSLAMLVSLTLKVCKVKPYVLVKYEPFSTLEASCNRIRELARHQPRLESADFIEATLFSREKGVVMSGFFSEKVEGMPISNVGKWYAPWFYTRVRDVLMGKEETELVPTIEYIFRHDRAIFWTLRDMLPEWVGNSVLFRYTLGWMCPPKIFMLKFPALTPALRNEMRTQRVYQDIVLPLKSLEESVRIAADEFEIWPILVYPSLIVDHGQNKRGIFPTRSVRSAPKEDQSDFNGSLAALFFDLGVYGIPHQVRDKHEGYSGVKSLRKMEHFTTSVGGAPFLYADTFMSPQEFESTFDLELYRQCRKKYGAEGAFFDLYEKTTSYRKGDELI